MKVDSKGNIVDWMDRREELAAELKGKSFEETQALYAKWNEGFSQFEGGAYYADWLRSMILIDRYFLLTEILLPAKIKTLALKPWLFERCREVEAEPDGYLDLWAREHFKTSVITHCGCIQEILKDPEITIGIFSHTKGIAKKILISIKNDLENNETLKACFPDILYKNPKKDSPMWTLEKFIVRRRDNPREATCEAWGVVDGQPTGAHFKLRVYDDLVTAESVNTPEQIEKTTEMLALSDNLGTQGGRVRFIGTRYSFGDTYQHMIDKGQVKTRIYAATSNGKLDGPPVFFTQAYWDEKKRSQTISTLACQMLQNPNAGSQAMFDITDLRFYPARPHLMNVYILVDPASSMKKGSDNTAIVVVGVDLSGNKYLLDGWHHKMELLEKYTKVTELYRRWSSQPGVVRCDVGYEKYGSQTDLQFFKLKMEETGNFYDIVELNTPRTGGGAKRDRMSRLDPDFRQGKILLPCLVLENGHTCQIGIVLDKETSSPQIKTERVTAEQVKGHDQLSNNTYGARPIKRRWVDGGTEKAYDLTMQFILQAQYVPNNSAHDDLVDAFSRIYDMDLSIPVTAPRGLLSQPAFD